MSAFNAGSDSQLLSCGAVAGGFAALNVNAHGPMLAIVLNGARLASVRRYHPLRV